MRHALRVKDQCGPFALVHFLAVNEDFLTLLPGHMRFAVSVHGQGRPRIRRLANVVKCFPRELPQPGRRGGDQLAVGGKGDGGFLSRKWQFLAPLLAVVDADTAAVIAIPGDGCHLAMGRHARPATGADSLRRHDDCAARVEGDKGDLIVRLVPGESDAIPLMPAGGAIARVLFGAAERGGKGAAMSARERRTPLQRLEQSDAHLACRNGCVPVRSDLVAAARNGGEGRRDQRVHQARRARQAKRNGRVTALAIRHAAILEAVPPALKKLVIERYHLPAMRDLAQQVAFDIVDIVRIFRGAGVVEVDEFMRHRFQQVNCRATA